ncbi:hypothetical protein MPC4_260006 [Methylocella tundrae]|uniref:Uncharacterized protein n=1 Tax=Methylocella tundrae TaxID=227605 RepID=A0A8B6M6A6_METTU|nr:hypothetical protein MPC4_260006 [Methylocella tundrae]
MPVLQRKQFEIGGSLSKLRWRHNATLLRVVQGGVPGSACSATSDREFSSAP